MRRSPYSVSLFGGWDWRYLGRFFAVPQKLSPFIADLYDEYPLIALAPSPIRVMHTLHFEPAKGINNSVR